MLLTYLSAGFVGELVQIMLPTFTVSFLLEKGNNKPDIVTSGTNQIARAVLKKRVN